MFGQRPSDTRIVTWSDQASQILFIKLGTLRHKYITRITGGCGYMEEEQQQGILDLFGAAFRGYAGAILMGGTRIIKGENPKDYMFAVTEIGPHIRSQNPDTFVVGITPRVRATVFKEEGPLLFIEHSEASGNAEGLSTVVHPGVDLAIHLPDKVTNRSLWHDEAFFCADIAYVMGEYADMPYLTVVYNGGEVTRYEVRQTLELRPKRPILIIQGSGRAADEFANDEHFLASNPQVTVCQKDPDSIRSALIGLGAIVPTLP